MPCVASRTGHRLYAATTESLAPGTPNDRIIVGESGIGSHADVDRLCRSSVRSFLVGESLMRESDVVAATKAVIWGASSACP